MSPRATPHQQRVLAIPGIIRIPIAIVAGSGLVWAGYSCFNYTDPYRWITEVQIDLMGMYFPMLSGVLTFAVCGIIGCIPSFLILSALAYSNLFPVDPDNPKHVNQINLEGWVQQNWGRFILLMAGAIFLVLGAIWTYQGWSKGSLEVGDLQLLETGNKPPSHYLRLKGKLLDDRMLSERDGNFLYYYTPLVSDKWKEGDPIRVYVRVSKNRAKEVNEAKVEGTLTERGLPGPLQTSFERTRGAKPAKPYYLLRYGVEPDTKLGIGNFFLAVGGGALVLFFLIGLLQSIRKARSV